MLPAMNQLSVRPMPSSRDGQRGQRVRPARTRRVDRAERFPIPVENLSLPILGARWQSALEAAQAALAAAARTLPPEELRGRRSRLDAERLATTRLLDGFARDHHLPARFAYLTTPSRELRRLLGLPDRIDACVFTLDGVVVGSATAHAGAWAEIFDSFLLARGERVDHPYRPFDRTADYYEHIHGKPRLEGTRSFLESRGISLPEGEPGDAPGTATVRGLANAKAAALLRRLEADPLEAYAGSRQYLEIARAAHVRRAVVSASANARLMLHRAGLSGLIDDCVDGSAMVAERLRAKPAPDTLLAACRRLDVAPSHAAAFETTESGVTAARTAGFALVVGVAANGQAQALRAGGADRVAGTLAELLVEELAA
jgi:HAD superfamily hydrolase (TIGR01509 family)